MSYEVWVKDIMEPYYSYLKECMRKDMEDSQGTARCQFEINHELFIVRWFGQQGIEVISAYSHDTDKTAIVKLSFRDKEHFTYWMLRWA